MARTPRTPQIHKFGGASLANSAAIRHAVEIIRAQPAPVVVVVSAMAGVTDALLALATAAVQPAPGRDTITAATRALAARHLEAARAVTSPEPCQDELVAEIERSFAELDAIVTGLRALHELTPRTSD